MSVGARLLLNYIVHSSRLDERRYIKMMVLLHKDAGILITFNFEAGELKVEVREYSVPICHYIRSGANTKALSSIF